MIKGDKSWVFMITSDEEGKVTTGYNNPDNVDWYNLIAHLEVELHMIKNGIMKRVEDDNGKDSKSTEK